VLYLWEKKYVAIIAEIGICSEDFATWLEKVNTNNLIKRANDVRSRPTPFLFNVDKTQCPT
jgi:hypothetical protein